MFLTAAAEIAKQVAVQFLNNQATSLYNVQAENEIKCKLDKVSLTNKRNHQQFDHCRSVLDKVDSAIAQVDNDVNQAKEALEQCKKIILKRMKLIRLADRENWDAVNEYLSDDLASDSADECHISKAIKSACSKAEKRKKEKRQTRSYSSSPYPYATRRSSESMNNKNRFENKICWGCGKSGHFRSTCYLFKRQMYAQTQKENGENARM